MIYVAHRGASAHYPENTLLAFHKALEAGVQWLELDVHLSADGELVVIHDETLERTTDGKGPVRSWPVQELRRLDAGQGEKIPLLRDVLDLVTGRTVVNIELKGHDTAEPTALLLAHCLRDSKLEHKNLLISSMEEKELEAFRAFQPDLKLALIIDQLPANLWQLTERFNLWSVHAALPLVTTELVAEAHRRGVRLLVFTVNHAADLRYVQQLKVDGIFTDSPALWETYVCAKEDL